MASVRPPTTPLAVQYRRPSHTRAWTDDCQRIGKASIQAAAPIQTGFLKRTIRTRAYPGTLGPDVRFEAAPDYAYWQEVGTGLHGPLRRYITPKRAKALSWISATSGQRVYAKKVRGVKPQRYFRKAFYATFGRSKVTYYGARGRPIDR